MEKYTIFINLYWGIFISPNEVVCEKIGLKFGNIENNNLEIRITKIKL